MWVTRCVCGVVDVLRKFVRVVVVNEKQILIAWHGQHKTSHAWFISYASLVPGYGPESVSVEDEVDIWRYAIVSRMPETKMTTLTCACWKGSGNSHSLLQHTPLKLRPYLSFLSSQTRPERSQASWLAAFLPAEDRPMFKGFKSDYTSRSHVCLGRPAGRLQSGGGFRIAAETIWWWSWMKDHFESPGSGINKYLFVSVASIV